MANELDSTGLSFDAFFSLSTFGLGAAAAAAAETGLVDAYLWALTL